MRKRPDKNFQTKDAKFTVYCRIWDKNLLKKLVEKHNYKIINK